MNFLQDSGFWESFCEAWLWENAQICRLLSTNDDQLSGRKQSLSKLPVYVGDLPDWSSPVPARPDEAKP
jgi:hypothetical protein